MHGLHTSMLLLLHSAFRLSVVKMLLKGEAGGSALNSHGFYIVDHGKSWKNHGIVFLNFCGNPVILWEHPCSFDPFLISVRRFAVNLLTSAHCPNTELGTLGINLKMCLKVNKDVFGQCFF